MARCARAVPVIFLQFNMLLMMYAGAGLVTVARLKWDPSTYVALRELLPQEYRVATVLLLVASLMLLLLAHLALVALYSRRARRLLLVMYAAVMAMMISVQTASGWWMGTRLASWSRSADAMELQRALKMREHLLPLLQDLAHWHALPQKISNIIKEAEADVPCNGYVVAAAAILLFVTQMAAAAFALLMAARASKQYTEPTVSVSQNDSSEKRPLRAVYKHGRLMMV